MRDPTAQRSRAQIGGGVKGEGDGKRVKVVGLEGGGGEWGEKRKRSRLIVGIIQRRPTRFEQR